MLNVGALTMGLVCLILIGVGALVLARSARSTAKRLFAAMCSGLALWVFANYMADTSQANSLFWTRATFFAVTVALWAFLLFVMDFPTPTRSGGKLKIPLALVALGVTVVTWLPLFIPEVTFSGDTSNVVIGPLYAVFVLYFVGYMAAALTLLFIKIHQEKRVDRERIKFILAGVLMMAVISSITNLFLPLLSGTNPLARYGTYSTLLFVAPIAYAIVRHRLFDIRLLAARFLAYTVLVVGLGLLYSMLIVAISFLNFDTQLSLGQLVLVTSLTIGLILVAQPLKRFFDRMTRTIFYQDAYDSRVVLDRVGTILVRAVSVNTLSSESLAEVSKAVKSEYAAAILSDAQQKPKRIIAFGKPPADLDVFVEEMAARRESFVVLDEIESQSTHLAHLLQRHNVSIVVRLETSKEKMGYIVFGYKATGNMYTEQDIGLIRTVVGELAVAILNALRFEEIEHFNETLQHRVEEATAKLRQTNHKLRALDEAKDEFISMASHQMRTPLTSVKGYISMVLEGYGGTLKPDQRKLLGEAYNSAQRMVYLIADFLNVSRIRTGKFEVETTPVRLTDLIRTEINQLEATAKSRGLTLIYDEPEHFPELMLDEEKTRQVIMNFIDNAIYYTQPGGTITVTLTATNKEVSFKVSDTGIGVPKSEQHQLFSKFFRATNALKVRPDGTGIGLFLAKRIIALQQGAIIFESKEGKGSTFGFRFPRRKIIEEKA